jgi:hypothetical protein
MHDPLPVALHYATLKRELLDHIEPGPIDAYVLQKSSENPKYPLVKENRIELWGYLKQPDGGWEWVLLKGGTYRVFTNYIDENGNLWYKVETVRAPPEGMLFRLKQMEPTPSAYQGNYDMFIGVQKPEIPLVPMAVGAAVGGIIGYVAKPGALGALVGAGLGAAAGYALSTLGLGQGISLGKAPSLVSREPIFVGGIASERVPPPPRVSGALA